MAQVATVGQLPVAQPAKPGKANGVIDPLNGICEPENGAVHAYGEKPLMPVIGKPP